MDKIYLVSNFCILLTLARVLLVYTRHHAADDATLAKLSGTGRNLLLGRLLFVATTTFGLMSLRS